MSKRRRKPTGFGPRSLWKEGARAEMEAAVSRWVTEDEHAFIRDSIRAGLSVEEIARGGLVMRTLLVRVLRSLPARRRGGLSRDARIAQKFLRSAALPRRAGRPVGTSEVPEHELRKYAELMEELLAYGRSHGYPGATLRETIRRYEEWANRGKRTPLEAAIAAKKEAPAIQKRIRLFRDREKKGKK